MDYPQRAIGTTASKPPILLETEPPSLLSMFISLCRSLFFASFLPNRTDRFFCRKLHMHVCVLACKSMTLVFVCTLACVWGGWWWYQYIDEHSHKTLMCWCKLWEKKLHWRSVIWKGCARWQFHLTPSCMCKHLPSYHLLCREREGHANGDMQRPSEGPCMCAHGLWTSVNFSDCTTLTREWCNQHNLQFFNESRWWLGPQWADTDNSIYHHTKKASAYNMEQSQWLAPCNWGFKTIVASRTAVYASAPSQAVNETLKSWKSSAIWLPKQ